VKFCQSLMFAAPDQWIELVRAAESAGFDQVALSDHVVQPEKLESTYPYTRSGRPMFPPDTPWPDVWVTIGALAARTERISFVTHVYVLPARNPFVVAKAVGTAAVQRFGRPVAYQDVPQELLPAPLRDDNPWNLPRRVDGVWERRS